MESKRDGCLLSELTRLRLDLPRSAQSPRPAVRRPAPTRLWYVRIWGSTNVFIDNFDYRNQSS